MNSFQNCFQSSGWFVKILNFVQIYKYIHFFCLFVCFNLWNYRVHNFKYKSNTKHSPLALCYFLFPNSLSLLQPIICVCPEESHSQTLCPHAHQKPLTRHSQYHGPLQISKLLCWISHDLPRIILAKEQYFVCVIVISKLQCLSCSRHSGSATEPRPSLKAGGLNCLFHWLSP